MTTSFTSPTSMERLAVARSLGLEPEALIQAFRLMQTSRLLDDREILLKRQNKIFFQVSGAGHEAIQVAAGMVAKAGYDYFYPYYRDRALCLTLGMSPLSMLLQAVGAAADPSSGGRQMPNHWSDPGRNIVCSSSATGTQFVQAVGCAEGLRFLYPNEDRIVMACSGEGATSEGEFWESINHACLAHAPVIFLIQDNAYAISVPVENQTPGGSISKLVGNHPGLFVLEVTDGTDFIASYRAMRTAAAYCREGHGPVLVHAHCTRPYSHSLSDDDRFYRTKREKDDELERDPLVTFSRFLVDEGLVERQELDRMVREIQDAVYEDSKRALDSPSPAPETALLHLHSDTCDPTSAAFDTPSEPTGEQKTMADLINATLKDEMRRNDRIVVFGEDVADCSREGTLPEVKGKGGVFKLTAGLQTEFGSRRCFNSPIAEASIVGRANGMATVGLKPVVEIQFFDYIWPAMMQIRDELASFRWRSNNGFSAPMVIRVPIGGYVNGAVYHSQSGEVAFTHLPGLRVVYPSNAEDAAGLLRTAIRCDDPVMFLEHKKLYREMYNRAQHPGENFMIPFGKARIVKPGDSLTVITYGAIVQKAVQAAQDVERRNPGLTVEVLDLRTLNPYDWEAIKASVEKTSRVIVAHEDTLSFGYGAEIVARIADELFTSLDAPVKRVAAKDTWVGYHPQLEAAILPQTDDLVIMMDQLLAW
jgi:2-oxoisovalerate dehydrogenase E1 component